MREHPERCEIPYHEYRAIDRLLRAHVDQYNDRVKAMVAFGDLVTTGNTFDIDLLEIVEGWDDKRFGRFTRTDELPLRGELRLYFLTPQEFQNPEVIQEAEERQWVKQLLERVRQSYEIVMESPPGWAQQVLDRSRVYSTVTPPPSGAIQYPDPYRLPKRGK